MEENTLEINNDQEAIRLYVRQIIKEIVEKEVIAPELGESNAIQEISTTD